MSESWDFYFTNVDGTPSSIFLDLGLRNSAPDARRPHLRWVWVTMRAPRGDGLSSSEEAPQLQALGEALCASLAKQLDALYVGRVTGAGRREFYFYSPSAGQLDAAVRDSLSGFPEYLFETGQQLDPEWSQYLTFLYPAPRQLQQIKNREVIEALSAHGDSLHIERPVLHWAYFASDSDRSAAAEALTARGYAVEHTTAEGDGTYPYGLRLERSHAVNEADVNSVVADILNVLDAYEAEYDGWESPVVKPQPPKRSLMDRLMGRAT